MLYRSQSAPDSIGVHSAALIERVIAVSADVVEKKTRKAAKAQKPSEDRQMAVAAELSKQSRDTATLRLISAVVMWLVVMCCIGAIWGRWDIAFTDMVRAPIALLARR